MNYSVAFGLMNTRRVALRTSAPENRIGYRFGDYVWLNSNPDARPAYISWTPTEQDIKADDWTVLEPDGSQVPEPRTTPDAVGAAPLSARGGRGEGSGWRRA